LPEFDAVVVGLGAVGSATLYQLAKRGARVLGIDRFSPPHSFGSSHGESRITRLAIGEGDEYVPLVARSHELWREIEAATGRGLLTVTGGLWISSPTRQRDTHVADFFHNTLRAARRFDIEHEVLEPVLIRERFPQFQVTDSELGYYEPMAGYLRPEDCIAAQLELAQRHGAQIRLNAKVEDLAEVATLAHQVVVAAGARLQGLLPAQLAQRFTVTRQVQFWFEPRHPEAFAAPRFPVFIWEPQSRRNVIYGSPETSPGAGVKVATEQFARTANPDLEEWRAVAAAESGAMHRELVGAHLPGLSARCVKAVPCLYTATRTFHFLIDRHPGLTNAIVASACSGHGFKHSAAVGEQLAEWVATGRHPEALRPFGWERHVHSSAEEEK
jgi:sarcosine oxidase